MAILIMVGDSYITNHRHWDIQELWNSNEDGGVSKGLKKRFQVPTVQAYPGKGLLEKEGDVRSLIKKYQPKPHVVWLALGGNDLRKGQNPAKVVVEAFQRLVHEAHHTKGVQLVVSGKIIYLSSIYISSVVKVVHVNNDD